MVSSGIRHISAEYAGLMSTDEPQMKQASACRGPIYPAKQILIDVGHSPSTMRTVGGPYTMACTDAEQTFMIPPSHQSAAIGRLLLLSMKLCCI
jgi:hypothetical protein